MCLFLLTYLIVAVDLASPLEEFPKSVSHLGKGPQTPDGLESGTTRIRPSPSGIPRQPVSLSGTRLLLKIDASTGGRCGTCWWTALCGEGAVAMAACGSKTPGADSGAISSMG